MKVDGYLKVILTIIAALLGVIVLERGGGSGIAYGQAARGNFDHVQFAAGINTFLMFDSSTGDVFVYDVPKHQIVHYTIAKPGAPLIEDWTPRR